MNRDWEKYFLDRLAKAEADLAKFKSAISMHGLRIRERDANGERDVTEKHLLDAEREVEEYRTIVRDISGE
jgi:hypothetical protein